jgi:hypothetical protein
MKAAMKTLTKAAKGDDGDEGHEGYYNVSQMTPYVIGRVCIWSRSTPRTQGMSASDTCTSRWPCMMAAIMHRTQRPQS